MDAKKVVICGAGVIGASIAYHLTLKGIKPTIIERSGVACSASGRAGGFLARDWCDSTPVGILARKSFQMHEELATTLGNTYGYRKLDTFSLNVHENSTKSTFPTGWMDGNITSKPQRIGNPSSTAQVHPGQFTHALINAAIAAGATLKIGTVKGLEFSGSNVTGVQVDDTVIPTNCVVIAMGVWTTQASAWLKTPKIKGVKAHSIILSPTKPVPAEAVFTEFRDTNDKGSKEPEVYPRPDGTVYICGESEHSAPIPDDPAEIIPNPSASVNLQKFANCFSSHLKDAELKGFQACFVPWAPDNIPLIGQIPKIQGAYIAAGHGCWGILNAPVTGLVMSELIVDGKSESVDISDFDPKRFY